MNDQPSDGHFEAVTIDGQDFRVPQAVADEVEKLRETHCQLAWTEIGLKDTIIITVPSKVSMEFQQIVGERAKEQFPQHRIAVLPEALGLHTQEGFGEVLAAGMKVATAVLEGEDETALNAAQAFVDRCRDTDE